MRREQPHSICLSFVCPAYMAATTAATARADRPMTLTPTVEAEPDVPDEPSPPPPLPLLLVVVPPPPLLPVLLLPVVAPLQVYSYPSWVPASSNTLLHTAPSVEAHVTVSLAVPEQSAEVYTM